MKIGRHRLRTCRWIIAAVAGWLAVAAGSVFAEGREIVTDPPGATVFWDWNELGQTPLRIQDDAFTPGHLLVVHLEDYQASYREITAPRSYYLRLRAQKAEPKNRLLLRVLGRDAEDFQKQLLPALAKRDFFVHPQEDVADLERFLFEIGSRDKTPLRAWARARYGTILWLVVRLPETPLRSDVSLLLGDTTPSVDEVTPEKMVSTRLVDLATGDLVEELIVESRNLGSSNRSRRQRAQKAAAEKLADDLLAWLEAELAAQPDKLEIVGDDAAGEEETAADGDSGDS